MMGQKNLRNPEAGENVILLGGIFRAKDREAKYDIYAKIGDTYLEADYCALHRTAEFDGLNEFAFSVQRRYMSEGEVQLIAVNRDTKETFCLETFEVVYGE